MVQGFSNSRVTARDKADDKDSLTGRKAPSNFGVSLVGSTLYHLLSGRWQQPYFPQEDFDKADDEDSLTVRPKPVPSDNKGK